MKLKKNIWKLFSFFGIVLGAMSFPLFLSHNNSNSIQNNNAMRLSSDGENYVVPKLINNSSNQSGMAEFNVNTLPSVSSSLKSKLNNSVTRDDVLNILIRNSESFFGDTLGSSDIRDKLDQASIEIENNYTYVFVKFVLNNVYIDIYGNIGSNDYSLFLYGFKSNILPIYLVTFIPISVLILFIIISIILVVMWKKRKIFRKKGTIIIENEIIHNY